MRWFILGLVLVLFLLACTAEKAVEKSEPAQIEKPIGGGRYEA